MSLSAIVVGVKGIGQHHARALQQIDRYRLVGICDRDEEMADLRSQELGVPSLGPVQSALESVKPDVVVIATPHSSHAEIGLQAVKGGARGIYCEKPMTVHLKDARSLVDACRAKGIALAVNHQRRMLPAFVQMRRLIEEEAVGPVDLIRASCAGDLLSDGTHLIDSLRFLAGDRPVEWVCGQVFGLPEELSPAEGEGFEKTNGRRFGHIVEESAFGVIQFEGGLRAEISTGTLFPHGRFYQDFEAFGPLGRIWRKSDSLKPNLVIQRGGGEFQEVPLDAPEGQNLEPLRLFADMVEHGAPHPLNGDSALADMEVITALYESARLREPVRWPVVQDRFPLDLMAAEAAPRQPGS